MVSACSRCRAIYRADYANCPKDGAPILGYADDPWLGATIGSRYVIESLIAEGGYSRVYRAYDWAQDDGVALKMLVGDACADRRTRARLLREATFTRSLHHPNIVRVHDVGETAEGQGYMVMDLVSGGTLARLVSDRALPVAYALDLGRQIAAGLAHAHARGVIHRDLKTTNVLLDEGTGRAWITDFGAALAPAARRDDRLTADGVCVGTLGWMSPEQAMGGRIDHRSDLFNLGLILYRLFAGVEPFDGTPTERHEKNITAAPLPIGLRAPGVELPRALEVLVFRMLAKKPEHRPADAQEVCGALEALARPKRVAS